MIVRTAKELETAALAAELAGKVEPGTVITLRGHLGSGKSVFARSLIRTLCGDDDLEVPSPTFTLVQAYDTPRGPLWHFDLYRLKTTEEVYELGWEEALSAGIVLIEWPEIIDSLLPPRHLDIAFQGVDNKPQHREITITHYDR